MTWKSSTGRPYVDTRNWKKYNEELVVRGEFLLDLNWVKSWSKELKEMNKGKTGHPYEYPESLIKLQAVWNQWIGVRQVEGITRQLVVMAQLPAYDDYTTVNRRVNKINPCFDLPKHGFCSIACDGSGFKMNTAGEYRYDKYGKKKRKKWLHVVLSANPLTKDMLDIDTYIDGDGDSEPQIAERHLNNLWNYSIEIDKFWGDGSFDVIDLFNLLEEHGTESAIPPRENASTNANGSMRRLREVFEYKTNTWQDWARHKNYGLRWLGTEGIFSAIKTTFGERTKAKTLQTMEHEIRRRFWAYETMRKYAKS